jgi:hypothetical protein
MAARPLDRPPATVVGGRSPRSAAWPRSSVAGWAWARRAFAASLAGIAAVVGAEPLRAQSGLVVETIAGRQALPSAHETGAARVRPRSSDGPDCDQRAHDGGFEGSLSFNTSQKAAHIAQRFSIPPPVGDSQWFLDDVCLALGRNATAGSSRFAIVVASDDGGVPGVILDARTIEAQLPALPNATLCVEDFAYPLAGRDSVFIALSWNPAQENVYLAIDKSPATPQQTTMVRSSPAGVDGLGGWVPLSTLNIDIRSAGIGIRLFDSTSNVAIKSVGGGSVAAGASGAHVHARSGSTAPTPPSDRSGLPDRVGGDLPLYEQWSRAGVQASNRRAIRPRNGVPPAPPTVTPTPDKQALLGGLATEAHGGADTTAFLVFRDPTTGEQSFWMYWGPTDAPEAGSLLPVSTPLQNNARYIGDELVPHPGSVDEEFFFLLVETGSGTPWFVSLKLPPVGSEEAPTVTFVTVAQVPAFNGDVFVLDGDPCVSLLRTDFSLGIYCRTVGSSWDLLRTLPFASGALNGSLGPETIYVDADGPDVPCILYSVPLSPQEFDLRSICGLDGEVTTLLPRAHFLPYPTEIEPVPYDHEEALRQLALAGWPPEEHWSGDKDATGILWQKGAQLDAAVLDYDEIAKALETIHLEPDLKEGPAGQAFDWFVLPPGPLDGLFTVVSPDPGNQQLLATTWEFSLDGPTYTSTPRSDFDWTDDVVPRGAVEVDRCIQELLGEAQSLPGCSIAERHMYAGLERPPSLLGGLVSDSRAARATSGSPPLVAAQRRVPRPCVRDQGAHCLSDHRFEVSVDWRDPAGVTGIGSRVDLTDDSGLFYFFNPVNLELIAKVHDACAAPQFQSHWVFTAGLTNVEYVARVFDSATGRVRFYVNPQKTAAQPVQDTAAFKPCPSALQAGVALPAEVERYARAGRSEAASAGSLAWALPGWARDALASLAGRLRIGHAESRPTKRAHRSGPAPAVHAALTARQGDCTPGPTTLCLAGGRFSVEAEWTTKDGDSGDGQTIPLTADTGAFWFFGSENVEILVKVLDGCSGDFNSFWVFAAGLTNVEVQLTVTDTESGSVKVYDNPHGRPFRPVQDTRAFPTCP